MPVISIVIPIYNEVPSILELAFESIRCQTFSDFEVLIVDDSSRADTQRKIIDEFCQRDTRFFLFRPAARAGLAKALNLGLKMAKGRYIARGDSDDIQESRRLLTQFEYMEAHPEIGVVGSAINKIDGMGSSVGTRVYPLTHSEIHWLSCLKCPIAHPTVFLRREVLDVIGGYDESFPRAEDYELWMRAIRLGVRFANLPEPLVNYRLASTVKRDRAHWKYNLKAKIRHLMFDKTFLLRCVGIGVVFGFYMTPLSAQSCFYGIYNQR